MILALVARDDLFLEQMDVKTTFLHVDLEEEIYMMQPQGFEVRGKDKMVCKLHKSFMVLGKLQDSGTRSLTDS